MHALAQCATCHILAYLFSHCPACDRTICYDCTGGLALTGAQTCSHCPALRKKGPQHFQHFAKDSDSDSGLGEVIIEPRARKRKDYEL